LWFTRKPLGVVRFDGERHLLSCPEAAGPKQFDLRQPFTLSTRVFVPMVAAHVRGGPSMIVTVEQVGTSLTFWFPWTLRELGSPVTSTTSEALPALRLDWRGAVILERLRLLARRAGPRSAPVPKALAPIERQRLCVAVCRGGHLPFSRFG
jgi:hypothetical protein